MGLCRQRAGETRDDIQARYLLSVFGEGVLSTSVWSLASGLCVSSESWRLLVSSVGVFLLVPCGDCAVCPVSVTSKENRTNSRKKRIEEAKKRTTPVYPVRLCLSVRLSVRLSVCLSVCLSV
ncbi:hypothetical protein H105_08897, partial [Trichophyton soudanense CBS 452.61]